MKAGKKAREYFLILKKFVFEGSSFLSLNYIYSDWLCVFEGQERGAATTKAQDRRSKQVICTAASEKRLKSSESSSRF